VDILVTFNTSFIKNGELITDKRSITENYAKSIYFIFDVSALICVIYQMSIHYSSKDEIDILHFLILVKFFKMKQFDLLIEKYWIRSKKWALLYAILKHLLLLVLLCHIIGSFFFLLDVKLANEGH
jgi:hypothetical protein